MHKGLVYLKGFARGKQFHQMEIAVNLAVKYHDGQKRKSGEEYVTHPMKVTRLLVALGIHDDNILAAAMLHDVLEDCDVSEVTLEHTEHVSSSVLALVKALSEEDGIDLKVYFGNIMRTKALILLKLADRCHNIGTMAGAFSLNKILDYIAETKEYVLPICKHAINYYPEISDAVVVMRDQIEAIISSVEGTIDMMSVIKKEKV